MNPEPVGFRLKGVVGETDIELKCENIERMNVMRAGRLLMVLGLLAGFQTLAPNTGWAQVGSPNAGKSYNIAVDSTVSGQFSATMKFVETNADVFFGLLSRREGTVNVTSSNPSLNLNGIYSELNLSLGGMWFSQVEGATNDGANYSMEFVATAYAIGPFQLLSGYGAGTAEDEFTFTAGKGLPQ